MVSPQGSATFLVSFDTWRKKKKKKKEKKNLYEREAYLASYTHKHMIVKNAKYRAIHLLWTPEKSTKCDHQGQVYFGERVCVT